MIQKIQIKSIKKLKDKHHVYDLSVQKNKNFFVGKTSTLTKNCDYLTPNAQAALRNLMETFSQHCRFILTCNYVEKMIDPIQSRCQSYKVTPPSKKEVAIHMKSILDTEGIEYSLDDMATIVTTGYPDIRKVINSLQRQSVDGKLKLDVESIIQNDYKIKLLELLSNNSSSYIDVRQLLADNSVSDYTELYRLLYDDVESYTDNIATAILIIAEGQLNDSQVVDKEINFISTIIKLMKEIR